MRSHCLNIFLNTYKKIIRPLLEYSPLVWDGAASWHLSRPHRVHNHSLSLIGPGVIVDSLNIRGQVSGLMYFFKLMWGLRSQHSNSWPHPRSAHQPIPELGISTNPHTAFNYRPTPCGLLQHNSAIFSCHVKPFHRLVPVWNTLRPGLQQ